MDKSRMTLRYVTALLFLGMIAFIIYYIPNQIVQSEKTSATLINSSGRQRMLSQQIALLSFQLVSVQDAASRVAIRNRIMSSTNEMEQAYYQLTRDSASLNDGLTKNILLFVQDLYLEHPDGLDYQVGRFCDAAHRLLATSDGELVLENEDLQYILAASSGPFLKVQDDLVNQFQQVSEARIERLQVFEKIGLSTILFILLLEALFIFRPMVQEIEKETKKLVESNAKLQLLSSLDGLTGIANRRYFDEFLDREWTRLMRNAMPLSLLILDLDFFKAFNDTYGHLGGDECLKQIGRLLADAIRRPADLVARYGGEEFVVVLPETTVSGATILAETIRASVEGLDISHRNSSVADKVTVSIGVAGLIPHQSRSMNQLIAAADQALYRAKQNGRNQVAVSEIGTEETEKAH